MTMKETAHVHRDEDFSKRRRALPAPARSAAARRRPPFRRRRPGQRRPCSRRSSPPSGPDYQPGRHAQRLDAAVAHERRLEGVPPGRRAGRARVRARHEGATCGATTASRPGPTIEAVEGDRVRIFVTNKLPEHTTVHWHGMLLPNGMDGVGGLTQPHIEPGKTFVYEFVLQEERHLHVPPARRRDGADGDGHDGHVRRPPARPDASAASTATSSSS